MVATEAAAGRTSDCGVICDPVDDDWLFESNW